MKKVFFILGAGASVDSGLFTYRDKDNGLYINSPQEILSIDSFEPEKVWKFLKPQYERFSQAKAGPTYDMIDKICQKCPQSFVMTQNIDRLIQTVSIDKNQILEIHGKYDSAICTHCRSISKSPPTQFNCENCNKGQIRPDIVLFGEEISKEKTRQMFTYIARNHVDYVVVIGTSMQFPYLDRIIKKIKHRGAKIIHINPDPDYSVNVKRHENWMKKPAFEGLTTFYNLI
jgi:NAD-dependent deacetylase